MGRRVEGDGDSGAGTHLIVAASANEPILRSKVEGDAYPRTELTVGGELRTGDGTTPPFAALDERLDALESGTILAAGGSAFDVNEGVKFDTLANPYGIFTAQHTADGQRDDLLKIGYNLDDTPGHLFGAKIDTADIAWQLDFENHYRAGPGDPNYSEFNIDWWSTAATGNAKRRPFSVLIDRDLKLSYIYHAAERHTWQPSDSSRSLMELKEQHRLGIGVSAGVTFHVRAYNAEDGLQNQQIVFGSDHAGLHTGIISSNSDTFLTDTKAWGIFAGPNNYLTGATDAVAMLLGTDIPRYTIARSANMGSPGVRDLFRLDTADPTSGNTVAWVAYHNGAGVVTKQVTIGAADSGGAGFKVLRVPNT